MSEETIVAVYDTAAHADAAVQDLEAAGVPASAIAVHGQGAVAAGSEPALGAAPAREPGFWSSLFGGEPEHAHDTSVYDRSLESGSVVVTVHAHEEHLTKVAEILERHHPIDIDERASSYSVATTVETQVGLHPHTAAATAGTAATGIATAGTATADQTIQLAAESLAVGKRAINRGTTRIRRYVVETPVEEHVSLRDETVTIERRPVADNRPVTDAQFTDKIVEMTETGEEVVVSKTAHVTEEVVIRKDTTERVETVHDTVRREEVEITKDAGVASTAAVPGAPLPAHKPGI